MPPPLFVVSPHFDDAVLSLGQAIGACSGSTVATVCTAMPTDADVLTDWDRDSGFTSAREAMTARPDEDRLALNELGTRQCLLGFVDRQYAAHAPIDTLVDALRSAIANCGCSRIAGPLGIRHPDHVLTADAFLLALAQVPVAESYVYAEIPYYTMWPQLTDARMTRLAELGWTVEPADLGLVDRARKQAALQCYASQVAQMGEAPIDIPERVWRISVR